MFIPVLPNIWRWTTPDPEDDWVMVGHLLQQDHQITLVDPPVVSGLLDALKALGPVTAIVLTTHDHTRGARYLHERLGCPVYVPEQANRDHIRHAGLREVTWYSEDSPLPGNLKAHRCRVTLPMWQDPELPYLDEMMLVTQHHAVITGDIVMGNPGGGIYGCPEGFNDPADPAKVTAALMTFRAVLPIESQTLLAGHGQDLVGNLRQSLLLRD